MAAGGRGWPGVAAAGLGWPRLDWFGLSSARIIIFFALIEKFRYVLDDLFNSKKQSMLYCIFYSYFSNGIPNGALVFITLT